jgi:hypothetical protein
MTLLATIQSLVTALTSLVSETAAAKTALTDFNTFLTTTI